MTDGDEKYKLGELTSDMATVKRDIIEIKTGQREILHRLDNLSVVSVEKWEERNAYVDGVLTDHDKRIESIEEAHKLDKETIWYKLRIFLEGQMIRIIGGAIVVGMLIAVFYYAQLSSEYSDTLNKMRNALEQEP